MPEPTASHQPALLTITEAADLLRAPRRRPSLLETPQHRPEQLPTRPPCPLPPRRPPRLDRRSARSHLSRCVPVDEVTGLVDRQHRAAVSTPMAARPAARDDG